MEHAVVVVLQMLSRHAEWNLHEPVDLSYSWSIPLEISIKAINRDNTLEILCLQQHTSIRKLDLFK